MRFPSPLIPATLIRRYKRFLADVTLASGEEITVHVANPGSMIGLAAPGSRVWLSKSPSATRKLPYSWELVEVDFGNGAELVGVNTGHPNLARRRGAGGEGDPRSCRLCIGAARGQIRHEFARRFPAGAGRPTALLCRDQERASDAPPGLAEFPDCVTARGAKHLDELGAMVAAGARAVMLYVIQIGSAERFSLARDIDPAYGAAFDRARKMGVSAAAWKCAISLEGIEIASPVPIVG